MHEIGLFASSIDTLDNVRNIIGNAKIFGDVHFIVNMNLGHRCGHL